MKRLSLGLGLLAACDGDTVHNYYSAPQPVTDTGEAAWPASVDSGAGLDAADTAADSEVMFDTGDTGLSEVSQELAFNAELCHQATHTEEGDVQSYDFFVDEDALFEPSLSSSGVLVAWFYYTWADTTQVFYPRSYFEIRESGCAYDSCLRYCEAAFTYLGDAQNSMLLQVDMPNSECEVDADNLEQEYSMSLYFADFDASTGGCQFLYSKSVTHMGHTDNPDDDGDGIPDYRPAYYSYKFTLGGGLMDLSH